MKSYPKDRTIYQQSLIQSQQMAGRQSCTYLSLVVLVAMCLQVGSCDLKCSEPQKGFYMSYDSLSNRDTLPNLFMEIDSKMTTYSLTYDDGKGSSYLISSLHPQLYYSEHHQKEIYIDPQHVNVSLGDITYAFRLDYNITKNGVKKSGWARGKVLLDQTAYFVKRLLIKDGFLEWDPTETPALNLTFPISIEYSEPTLEYDQKSAIELMLNDHVGDKKTKQQIMDTFNQHYQTLLKQHLNKENIIGSTNINYSYKNITMNFVNAVKNYTLANNQVKGLEAFFFFEVENKTTNCTPDKINFNENDYGGVQEIYSLSSMREALKYAYSLGLADVKLDKKWEVPSFQLYMGDLANAVSYAANFPADDPFTVECTWDKKDILLTAYDAHEIYATVGQVCIVVYKGSPIIQIQADISFVVTIVPEDDTLSFVILGANNFNPSFKSLNPNYIVNNSDYARYAVGQVLTGLSKSMTFGSGWKTLKRKFPAVRVNGDYLIIFDPSER